MADDAEIRIYDAIGPDWAGMVSDRAVINALDQLRGAKKIHVRLNTPGGDAFMGVSIMNAFRRHEAKIIIHVDALAASAGSIAAMGGDQIIMHEGAMMMIHRAWTIALGNAEDMAKVADTLGKVDSNMVDIYHRKSGLDKAKVKQLVDSETWMGAQEAVDMGFADDADLIATGAQAKAPNGWYSRAPETLSRYNPEAKRTADFKFSLGIAACIQPQDAARKAHWESLKKTLRVA
jgi:ATP-dependent protease ClpP protease subunit